METSSHITPAVVLINPQMGENIGAAARAMLNCGLTDLRIVNPRDGWPSEQAHAMSSGALDIMPPVQVFKSTKDAITDCTYTYATTARPRDMVKPVYTAASAAENANTRTTQKQKVAFLFGGERAGLSNDDVALAQAIITIPLNPDFSSLNLGQAVLLTTYEWSKTQDTKTPDKDIPLGKSHPAPMEELTNLYRRLEDALEQNHFFRVDEMRPTIMRNIQNMLARAEMTDQEVRTFHGMISALTGQKTPL